MPVSRCTKLELQAENTRLTAEVTGLREFVFDIDLGRENSNLQAQRAALQEFLQEQPPPEPFIAIKADDRHGYPTK